MLTHLSVLCFSIFAGTPQQTMRIQVNLLSSQYGENIQVCTVDMWIREYVSTIMQVQAYNNSSCVILDSQEGSFPVVTDTKVPWSDEETLHLLDIWGKDSMQRALKGCLKNRHIFTQIAQKMAERGYMRTVEQCQTRIKRLKKCFRQNNKWVLNDGAVRAVFISLCPITLTTNCIFLKLKL